VLCIFRAFSSLELLVVDYVIIISNAVTFYVEVEVYLKELYLKLITFSIVLIRYVDLDLRGLIISRFRIRSIYYYITYYKSV
jgi:hypothetical protein